MPNADTTAAREFHNRTAHSYQSVRSSGHDLDWDTKPLLYKIYVDLPETELPRDFDPLAADTLLAPDDPHRADFESLMNAFGNLPPRNDTSEEAVAIRYRDKEAHKRLMILAYASIMPAAVARLPGVLPLGPFGFFGLAYLFAFFGMAYDVISRRRIHPVYVWGGLLLVASVPGRLMLSGTSAWLAFAEAITR